MLDRAPHLAGEQGAAVLQVGRAGAGKTTAAAAIATAYREAGYEVCGAAHAGKAAENLQQEAGIRSRTLHSWGDALSAAGVEKLHAGSVLVIDEAGMVDAASSPASSTTRSSATPKVILLGDPDQLKPIGPGDACRRPLSSTTRAPTSNHSPPSRALAATTAQRSCPRRVTSALPITAAIE